ncbi:hypothetical protein DEJ30_12055 [Curtobacterium sp. MCPF17_003]|uniref:helix-turn-helix domain-containing protein n=1 Tax=Curtobacterium sp. MCPF17_003 TaxID=2175637 RepID=UPI000D8F5D4C|nr:helix-turn-helix domain-containing protein [Curtobacterium sp. MCPF17_003]PYY63640.1 hypothetical protein DEJ30_12055 [Curtobacterium sp. MCPF17_003]
MVDAAPARRHVRALSDFGIGIDRVAMIANVTEAGIRNLMYGRTGKSTDTRRHPPKRVGAELSRRILAVRPEVRHVADRGFISSQGTHRRIQALVRQGWSQRKLASRLGMSPAQFNMILRADHVTAGMHRKIVALFADLWDKLPDRTRSVDLNSYNRSVNYAKAHGWHPPLAWDDIDLDDRPAEALRNDSVDDMAVELAVAGEDVRLTPAERRLAVTELHSYGLTDPDIAERLHCSDRTVLRIREELDLPYNDNPYSPPSTAAAAAA